MTPFQLQDPNFEPRVRGSFARQTALSTIGATMSAVAPGEVENLLAPAIGERFVARGRVLRPGRTITVCRGDVFAQTPDRETLVATMLATMMSIRGRGGIVD